jgi:hypothetical protein
VHTEGEEWSHMAVDQPRVCHVARKQLACSTKDKAVCPAKQRAQQGHGLTSITTADASACIWLLQYP